LADPGGVHSKLQSSSPIAGFQLVPPSVVACVVPALTYWLATLLMRKAATADLNAPRHLVEPNI